MALFDNIVAILNLNGNAQDGSGNGYHGVLSGSPTLTTDNLGNANSAYNINVATQDRINLGNINIGSTDTSIFFWARSNVSNYGTSGYYHTIFKKSNTQMDFYVRSTTWTSIMRVGGLVYGYSFTGALDGNWHLIGVVKDSVTGKLHYYKNGVEVSSQAAVGTLDSYSDNFYYGYTATTNNIFNGTLGKMWLWNRAISASEALELYNISSGNHSILSTGEYLSHNVSNFGIDMSGVSALYNFNGNGLDSSGSGNHATAPYGSVSYGSDSLGNYLLLQGDRNYNAGTGTYQDLYIGTGKYFNQTTDFSWSTTFSVDSLPPNNSSGIFGSSYQSCVFLSNYLGAMNVYLRGSSTVGVGIGSNYWGTRLGEIHTVGFTYKASETKFYVYLDGVLQNTGGTLGPATFFTNSWYIGDHCVGSSNASSSYKRVYSAVIFPRVLTELEHLQIHDIQMGKTPRIKGKTMTKYIDTNTPISVHLRQQRSILQANAIVTI